MKTKIILISIFGLAVIAGLGLLMSCDEEKALNTSPTACLQITSFQQSGNLKSVNAGGSYTFTREIKNDGPSDAKDVILGYYLSTDDKITTSDTPLNVEDKLDLPSGTNNIKNVDIKIPASVAPGTKYYIGVLVTSSSCTNNCPEYKSLVLTIAENNDAQENCLMIDWSIEGSGLNIYNFYSGEVLNTIGTIENEGTYPCTNVVVRYYLSDDSIITTDDTYLNIEKVIDIPSGVYAFQEKIRLPNNLINRKQYYLGILIVSSDCINVCQAYSYIMLRYEDTPLRILHWWHQRSELPDFVIKDRVTTFTRTIYNDHETDSCSNIRIGYYISNDMIITSSDMLIHEETISQLLPKETNKNLVDLVIPSTAPDGNSVIGLLVLSSDCAKEMGPSASKAYTIHGTACIRTSLSIKEDTIDVKRGQEYKFRRIINNEHWECNDITVRYYLYPATNCRITCSGGHCCDSTLWNEGIYLGVEETFDHASANYWNDVMMNFRIPSGIAPGYYRIVGQTTSSDCNIPGRLPCGIRQEIGACCSLIHVVEDSTQ